MNGDFERAGDDPADIPGWEARNRAGLAIRADGAGPDRDASLALNGGTSAVTDPEFAVTNGETLVFTLEMRVLAGNGRATLEFMDVGGRLVDLRRYDLAAGTDWTTLGSGAPILVPAGSLYGRITLESYIMEVAPGVPSVTRQNAFALVDNVHVSN